MTKYFVGTSGFSYEHWISRFYPKSLERGDWLSYYAKYFNTQEINMSFYRFPFPNMLKGWYNKTPKSFVFTLKANRMITHVKKLNKVRRLVNDFYKLADLLKEKLGCILFQLPPNLKFDEKRLESFLKILNDKYKNVIEFRNQEWYCKETYNLLKKYDVGFCVVSGLDMPPDVKVTSNLAYFRFHGPTGAYSSCYSKYQLKTWAEKIKKTKAKEKYAYFNNDDHAYAIKNAFYLKKLLKC